MDCILKSSCLGQRATFVEVKRVEDCHQTAAGIPKCHLWHFSTRESSPQANCSQHHKITRIRLCTSFLYLFASISFAQGSQKMSVHVLISAAEILPAEILSKSVLWSTATCLVSDVQSRSINSNFQFFLPSPSTSMRSKIESEYSLRSRSKIPCAWAHIEYTCRGK